MENTGLIFVYGTLKVGGFYSKYFDQDRLSSVKGYIIGELYDLGNFPALVLRGENKVFGEIHEYSNFRTITKIMDRVEGYSEDDIDNSLYVRKTTKATTKDGETVDVLVYEIGGKIMKEVERLGSGLKIKSGIWDI